MPPRSSPSITSTTKRAKCLSGSHSSTDGGRRNAVRRSKSRKLLIAIKPPFGANQWRDSSENQRRWVKSDRLLVRREERGDLGFEARRVEADEAVAQDAGLDRAGLTALVMDQHAPVGIENQVVIDAGKREVTVELDAVIVGR